MTCRVTTVGTLLGVQDFFLQAIMKDRPNYNLDLHNIWNVSSRCQDILQGHFLYQVTHIQIPNGVHFPHNNNEGSEPRGACFPTIGHLLGILFMYFNGYIEMLLYFTLLLKFD